MVSECKHETRLQKDNSSAFLSDLKAQSDYIGSCVDNAANYLNNAADSIKEVSIPKEIKVKKEMNFSDRTKTFLAYYFLLSFTIVAISLFSAFYFHQRWSDREETLEYHEELNEYFQHMRKIHPKDTDKWFSNQRAKKELI